MNLGSVLASRPEASRAGVSTCGFQPGAAPLAWPRIPASNIGLDAWFLTATERGNSATRLDSRHLDGAAWTTGNQVRLLLHGAAYFIELLAAVRALEAGDLLLFTDWRGDPDERLDGPGTEVSRVLAEARRPGVIVRGLLWRSHLDRFRFSLQEHRDMGEAIVTAGGECLLDSRVRARGSHHQKLVVLRHRDRLERDVAYVGGIDLCHGRRDHLDHRGDEQPCPLGAAYGPHPPWHDIQIAIHGPGVADIETVFRERWEDPTPLSRNPLRRWRDRSMRPGGPPTCPEPLPDPPRCGTDAVQVLRTYPYRRRGYSFAPYGERPAGRVRRVRRQRPTAGRVARQGPARATPTGQAAPPSPHDAARLHRALGRTAVPDLVRPGRAAPAAAPSRSFLTTHPRAPARPGPDGGTHDGFR